MSRSIAIYVSFLKFKTYRIFLIASSILLIFISSFSLSAQIQQILEIRVWPFEDYTRIMLENKNNLKITYFIIKNPERLVVDIANIHFNTTLKKKFKIQCNDPYIKNIRVGKNYSGIVRLVFVLKKKIKIQTYIIPSNNNHNYQFCMNLSSTIGLNSITTFIPNKNWFKNQSSVKSRPVIIKNNKLNKFDLQLKRAITIALDPGHGGIDSGAISNRGNYEKDIVLSIAKRLKKKIEKQTNMRVILTRDADFFVPLEMRVKKARDLQADLFVSIHADAFVESTARGSSVFVLSEKGASSTAAHWLANKENIVNLVGSINSKSQDKQLASVLLDLSTTAQIQDSLRVGKAVLNEISNINKLHRGAVEQAGFAVLKAPDIPSILIEIAFISNPNEEAKLINSYYQDNMANAILNGIKKYFSKNPPLAKNKIT